MTRWWERPTPARFTFPLAPRGALNTTYSIIENENILNHNLVTSCQLKHPVFRDPRAYVGAPREPDLIWNGVYQTDVFLSFTDPDDTGCELEDYLRNGESPVNWYQHLILIPLITACVALVILGPWPWFRSVYRRKRRAAMDEGSTTTFYTAHSTRGARAIGRGVYLIVATALALLAAAYPLLLYLGFDLWSPGCVMSKLVYNSYFGSFTKDTGSSYRWDLSDPVAAEPAHSWKRDSAYIDYPVLAFPGVGEVGPILDQMSVIFKDLNNRNIIFSSPKAAMRLPWSALVYTDACLDRQKFHLPIWTSTGGSELAIASAEGADGIQLHHRLAGQILSEQSWSIDVAYSHQIALVSALLSAQVVPPDLHESITKIVDYGYLYVAKVRHLVTHVLNTLDWINSSLLSGLIIIYGGPPQLVPRLGSADFSIAQILRASCIVVPGMLVIVIICLTIQRWLLRRLYRNRQGETRLSTAQNIPSNRSRRSSCRAGLHKITTYGVYYTHVCVFILFLMISVFLGLGTRKLARNCNFIANRLFEESQYHNYPYFDKYNYIKNEQSPNIEVAKICLYKNSTSGNLFAHLDQWNSWNDLFKTVNQIFVETSEVFGGDLISMAGESNGLLQVTIPSPWVSYIDNMVPEEWAIALPSLSHYVYLAGSPVVFATDLQTARLMTTDDRTGRATFSRLTDKALKLALLNFLTDQSNHRVDFPSLANKPVWLKEHENITSDQVLESYELFRPTDTTKYIRSLIPDACASGKSRICVEWDQLCLTELISNSTYPISFGYTNLPYIDVSDFQSETKLFGNSTDPSADKVVMRNWFKALAGRTRDEEMSDLILCMSFSDWSRARFFELINAMYLTITKSIVLNDVPMVRSSDNYLLENEKEIIELCVIGQPCHLYHIQSGPYTNIYPKDSFVRRLKGSLQAAARMRQEDLYKVFMHAYASINAPTRLWKSVDAFQSKIDCRHIRDALYSIHGSVCNRTGPSLVLLTMFMFLCTCILGASVLTLLSKF